MKYLTSRIKLPTIGLLFIILIVSCAKNENLLGDGGNYINVPSTLVGKSLIFNNESGSTLLSVTGLTSNYQCTVKYPSAIFLSSSPTYSYTMNSATSTNLYVSFTEKIPHYVGTSTLYVTYKSSYSYTIKFTDSSNGTYSGTNTLVTTGMGLDGTDNTNHSGKFTYY